MEVILNTLELRFSENRNAEIALAQKAYMRNQFEYYGLKSPVRKEIQKPFLLKNNLPTKQQLPHLIETLWLKPQREYQYFAQELFLRHSKQFEVADLELMEFMVVNKSWWDTVDFIAVNLIGNYFKAFPEQRDKATNRWMASNNIWLQRSAILFQLKYKEQLDTVFLTEIIEQQLDSKEFFINKAIGWILREYSKTNPDWVITFVDKTVLSHLSKKEALRLMK